MGVEDGQIGLDIPFVGGVGVLVGRATAVDRTHGLPRRGMERPARWAIVAAPDPVIVANLDGAEAGTAAMAWRTAAQRSGERDLDLEGAVVRRSDRAARSCSCTAKSPKSTPPGPFKMAEMAPSKESHSSVRSPSILSRRASTRPCSHAVTDPGWQLAVADRRRHRHHVRHQVEHGP